MKYAVSYTHLDVYKRQGYHSVGRPRMTRFLEQAVQPNPQSGKEKEEEEPKYYAELLPIRRNIIYTSRFILQTYMVDNT